MNIYLDTNILYSDPFFKSSFSELLLKSSGDKTINICIPSICLNELLFKLVSKAEQLENDVKAKLRELNKWTNNNLEFESVNLKDYEITIIDFYKTNIKSGVFEQIDYEQEFFTENLEKAIKGIAPFFTDKKEEFRDSLIWSTVREHSNQSKLSKNYLITTNFADFWNHEKTDFHSNLKAESGNLVIIENIKKLFDIETQLIDFRKRNEFRQWLDSQKISVEIIKEAVMKYLWNHIVDNIDKEIKIYSIKNVKPEYEMGYILPNVSKDNFQVISIVNKNVFEDFASFEIQTSLNFEGKLYYPNYERGDFSNFETQAFLASIRLFITYNRDQLFRPMSLEITKIEIE